MSRGRDVLLLCKVWSEGRKAGGVGQTISESDPARLLSVSWLVSLTWLMLPSVHINPDRSKVPY